MPADLYPRRQKPAQPAAERFAGRYFSPQARRLMTPDATAAGFLRALAGADLWPDAFAVIAHVLPARPRLWWACLCLRGLPARYVTERARANFDAVVRWVREPTEANRLAAGDAAAASGPGVLAYRLARAVLDPGGSAELIIEALTNILEHAGPEFAPQLARSFVVFGIDVERGAVRLPPPEAAGGEHV